MHLFNNDVDTDETLYKFLKTKMTDVRMIKTVILLIQMFQTSYNDFM